MNMVNRDLVRACLRELGHTNELKTLWSGKKDDTEQSSFVELYSALFDDSGLGGALEDYDNVTFSVEIDNSLRVLMKLLDRIDEFGSPNDILNDSNFLAASKLSIRIHDIL